MRLLLVLLLLAAVLPSWACFGPKLYLAPSAGAEGEVLFALVSLYVKEKTGTDTVRVDPAGEEPLALLRGEKADLAFSEGGEGGTPLLAVDGLPVLLAGRRPVEDLQFTTVAPALKKLAGLLAAADVAALAAEVEGGAPPLAAVRRFLMARGWI